MRTALSVANQPAVHLRLAEADDAGELFQLINPVHQRKHLQHQLWIHGITDVADAELHVANKMHDMKVGDTLQYRVMEGSVQTETPRIIGSVTLHARNPVNSTAYLGYWLEQDSVGKGYALAATREVLHLGQQAWGLRQIKMDISPENTPSERLATRLGAQPTGVFEAHDAHGSAHLMQLWSMDL